MILQILGQLNSYNEICTNLINRFVQMFFVPEFLVEPISESISLIPFLFFIFVIIEIIENYFSEKIQEISINSKVYGPLIGSLIAIIPQCGFSVIATILYTKRYITVGTLIAVYLATSDEAIPILLLNPDKFSMIIPILAIKLFIGIFFGYLFDFIFKSNLKFLNSEVIIDESGCCHNKIHSTIRTLFVHPLKHTFNVFVFILLFNTFLSIGITKYGNIISGFFDINRYFQVLLSSLIGLIPNCGASVLIVMLYLKNVLSFSALISGLSSNAGLGLLVLFKNNSSVKNSIFITFMLFVISCFVGMCLLVFT